MPETMSDDYLNVPVQSGFLSQDDINAHAITRARFMRSQLKVATAEDVKLVEFPNIYQDINVASRHAKLPKFKLETIFTATSLVADVRQQQPRELYEETGALVRRAARHRASAPFILSILTTEDTLNNFCDSWKMEMCQMMKAMLTSTHDGVRTGELEEVFEEELESSEIPI
ncbi:unnamed protein product [Spodoptera exigua]|nr:unnamed protein product [Spodoptera exigua]